MGSRIARGWATLLLDRLRVTPLQLPVSRICGTETEVFLNSRVVGPCYTVILRSTNCPKI
jgi:hypothetical protein